MRKQLLAVGVALALASPLAAAQGMMGPGQGMMGPGQGMGQGMMGQGMMGQGMGPGMMGMGPGMMGDMREHRRGMKRHMMMMLFALVDQDGNEALSLEEVQAVHARIFKYADADDDGSLSMEEVAAFMHGGDRDDDDRD